MSDLNFLLHAMCDYYIEQTCNRLLDRTAAQPHPAQVSRQLHYSTETSRSLQLQRRLNDCNGFMPMLHTSQNRFRFRVVAGLMMLHKPTELLQISPVTRTPLLPRYIVRNNRQMVGHAEDSQTGAKLSASEQHC